MTQKAPVVLASSHSCISIAVRRGTGAGSVPAGHLSDSRTPSWPKVTQTEHQNGELLPHQEKNTASARTCENSTSVHLPVTRERKRVPAGVTQSG